MSRVRLTERGIATAICCAGCAVGGWLLGYPELIALAVGALAALLAAAGWAVRGPRLAVSRQVAPALVQRGDAAVAAIRIANRGRRATRPLTALDRVGATPVRVDLPALGRAAASSSGYRLPTGRRGRLVIGPLLLRSDDPFGLARRVQVHGQETELLIHPRTAPLVAEAYGRRASLDGPYSESAPSGTAVFHALREYVPGDSLRHVHWRTSARTGALMVRQLVDTALPETIVVLDSRATSYPEPLHDGKDDAGSEDEFDIAVDAAATIAAGMAAAGFPAVVLTSGGARYRAGGPQAVPALLDQLAELTRDPTLPALHGDAAAEAATAGLGRAIERARRSGSARGGLALVTGARSDLPGRPLAAARAHFERTVVLRAARHHQATEKPTRPAAAQNRAAGTGLAATTVSNAREAAAAWQRGRR